MCEISIIIPVYNKREYLKNTIKTISDQTFRDYELLLIDDGSTDGSGKVCDELAVSDARIRVFHTENHGVSAARNFALQKGTGKYISFIDADDIIDRTFLEKLYNSIESTGSDLVSCDYYEIKYGKRINRDRKSSGTGDELYDVLRYDVLCILWNKLYVREKIRHQFDERISTCEDSLFCAQYYYDNRPKVSYVNEALYGYIRHQSGLTESLREHAFLGANRFFSCNMKIAGLLRDERRKRLAVHHLCRIYFYTACLFIFENVCKGRMNRDALSAIEEVICHRRYQNAVKYIIRYRLYDKSTERTSLKEYLYFLFSILKWKRMIYLLAKVKKCLEPYKPYKNR